MSVLLYEQTKATPDDIGLEGNNHDRATTWDNRLRAHDVGRITLGSTKQKKKQNNYEAPSDSSTTKISSLLAEPSTTRRETEDRNPPSPSFYTSSAPFENFQMDLSHGLHGIGSQFNDPEDQIEEMHKHLEQSTVGTLKASHSTAIKTESGVYILSGFGGG